LAIRERTLVNLVIGVGLVPLACFGAIVVSGGFSKQAIGLSDAFFIMNVAWFAYLWTVLFSGLGVFLAFRLSRQSGQKLSIISHGPPLVALIVLAGPLLYFIWVLLH
jgi:uncharacterized membrane protein